MAKQNVLVLGAGKIGSLICCMLAQHKDYSVYLGNLDLQAAQSFLDKLTLQQASAIQLDARNAEQLNQAIETHEINTVVSALPYYCNPLVADLAASHGVNYFDLTEDVEVTHHVKKVSEGQSAVFMPQCGLAPGFISIVANELMQSFDSLEMVKMRVGALPVNPNNTLKYSLTWSTDGLINEYGNTCYGIENGVITPLLPLEGMETISLDGVLYEAFNTSGGLGTLADTYAGQVNTMNYKTLRYPGHCKNIKLLMNDLKLNQDRDTLKRILEKAIPKTLQDVVLVYVAVSGISNGDLFEKNYVKKVYPQTINKAPWSSIQVTTAAGLCGVMDIILNSKQAYKGFVTQEQIRLSDFLSNRFGQYYEMGTSDVS